MGALRLGLVVAAFVGVYALPSSALATEDYYFGSPTSNVYWPYCGSSSCPVASQPCCLGFFLNESSARTVNTRTVCAATFDTAVVCSNDVAYKALCACEIRRAYSRSTVGGYQPQGRARAVW